MPKPELKIVPGRPERAHHKKPALEDVGGFGEEAACALFKKYSKPTRSRHRRDTDLLLRFYTMENPKKLTLAKQIDPSNPERVLAQLKRALRDKRYARFRKWLALVKAGHRSSNTQDVVNKWQGLFDQRFPGRR
jgi:hypothetical protein